MKPFLRENGIAVIIPGPNIDTDQIIPARFLKEDRKQGYGRFLFHDLRINEDGTENPDFVLNQEPYRRASILITDENFGCGSSREAAVYALADYGIRALIGPNFGDIFYNNCLKNGILPLRFSPAIVAHLRELVASDIGARVEVDLVAMQVSFPDDSMHRIQLDPFWRTCLLEGIDDLTLTLRHSAEIQSFISEYERAYPWASLDPGTRS